MGIFATVDELKAKALKIAKADIDTLLIEGEGIETVEHSAIDYICLTNKRVFVVDKSFGSSKKGIFSFTYARISEIGIVKGGAFSISKELQIRVGSHTHDVDFYSSEQAANVYRLISEKMQ